MPTDRYGRLAIVVGEKSPSATYSRKSYHSPSPDLRWRIRGGSGTALLCKLLKPLDCFGEHPLLVLAAQEIYLIANQFQRFPVPALALN